MHLRCADTVDLAFCVDRTISWNDNSRPFRAARILFRTGESTARIPPSVENSPIDGDDPRLCRYIRFRLHSNPMS